MTANKKRKRLVRQRAQRTGESYASALRHLAAQRDKERAASGLAWRRIEKCEYGYAVRVPEDWEERPPNLRDNPSETARFVHPDDRRHHVRLLRWPVSPGANAADIAEDVRAALQTEGFGEFEQTELVIAGRPGVQLDCVLRDAGRILALRDHLVVKGDFGFCLAIGTNVPEEDADLLRAIGRGFELLPTGNLSEGEETTVGRTVPRSDERRSIALASLPRARSAASRPRGQKGGPVSAGGWRRIEKREYGYAVGVPVDWEERPPNLKNSPWETARFVDPAEPRHHCGVFRVPNRPGTGLAEVAEEAKAVLADEGFEEFEQREISIAGRPGVELRFARRDGGGIWTAREHFVVEGTIAFCLAIGTTMPDEDAELIATIAQGFELLPAD